MDEVWCGLDMATDISGLHGALTDPFWPAFTDCAATASFIANDDNACFGVADADLMGSTDKVENMDPSGFLGGEDDGHLVLQHELMQSSASSSLSSKRSLSIDSGGSSASFAVDASIAAAAANVASQFPGGDDDDAAIMRAMMAVISTSSTSPSSSMSCAGSSPPPFSRDCTMQQAAMPQPRGGNGHVMVSSSIAMPPEKTASLSTSGGGRGQQQEEARTASGSSQLYHMMSERKRREKLNDSFHTLRSLLPPCSKKDKTTVLINATNYLKTLEAQVSELEEKNTKLERHVPCEDGAGRRPAAAVAAQQRAKVKISKVSSEPELVNLTVMVMVECDIVDLVLHILESLRWMKEISVLSVDADTYSPQLLLKAIASIKLQIMDGDWNEASFYEAMTKAAGDATSSCAPLLLTA